MVKERPFQKLQTVLKVLKQESKENQKLDVQMLDLSSDQAEI